MSTLSPERDDASETRTDLAERRTSLAQARTVLANDRTFLAWIRTATGILATGLAVLHFLGDRGAEWRGLGAALAGAAGGVAAAGLALHRAIARRIDRGEPIAGSPIPVAVTTILGAASAVALFLATRQP